MDHIEPDKLPIKTPISNTIPIRIRKTTARLLQSYLKKCNRKAHGRRVKADDIIAMAISLLDVSHLEKIQIATYSSQDQLEIEFKKFCQTSGQISKDEFLKMLLLKAIPHVNIESPCEQPGAKS